MKEFTYIINLKERTDRILLVAEQMRQFGFKATIWEATKNEDGRQGLIQTMRSLFNYWLKTGYDRVLILEDDFKIVHPEFSNIIEKCVSQLPANFDLFYLGCNLHGKFSKYSDNLLRGEGMYATHAILYTRKAILKIMPSLNRATAYDIALVEGIQREGNCYCAMPLLISQQSGFSDIEKKDVNYEKFIEKRYAENTKGV